MHHPITLVAGMSHSLLGVGLYFMVSKLTGVQLKAHAQTAQQLLQLVQVHRPDIVLITNTAFRDMSAGEVCRTLHEEYPGVPVIVVTETSFRSKTQELLKAGVRGILFHSLTEAELEECILKVHGGGVSYCSEVRTAVQEVLSGQSLESRFSEVEIRILQMICEEKDSAAMARELCLSKHSIDMYRKNLLQKCEAQNAIGLIKFAILNGLVEV